MADDSPAWYVTSALSALAAYENAEALRYQGRSISYRELLATVHRTARFLERRGLRRGQGIVLVSRNRPEAFAIRLAAHLLGLRYTPVFPDTVADADGLRHLLTDAQATALVSDLEIGPVADLARSAGVPLVFSLVDLMAVAEGESDEPVPVRTEEGDIARILYTGGTTGRPKGVPATFAGLGASTKAWAASAGSAGSLPEGTRFLLTTPFAHGSGDAALNTLRLGASVEIMDGFDPAEFVAAVHDAPAAITYLYPSWLYRLLDHTEATGADLTSLKFVMYGSSPIAPARLRQALERLGPGLMQTYATTEAPAIATLQPADHAAALTGRPELLASVGRPMPGVTVTLRRTDGTTPPPGEVGEVCVQGPGVMTEYWNRPDDLRQTVLPDGRLRTGDLGRFDDGYLYLVGRLKDMIIVDGYNHYAGTIEDVLTEHPAVREAAVIGVPDERTGEAIHAFVTVRPPGITPDTLRAWASDHLPTDAVPITITVLDDLPLTPLGKPDKKALRARAASTTRSAMTET
ncbi:fatty-acid--CoA ligase FadD8 [Actinoallomurus vinaceus]|uniref:Fatty-acid--CoA ligase FadD8 n=1 Tax=Actinoallomurus vinaceus TaxID=1080074 RepID=A0ABP8UHJ1_9ACTN